MCRAKYTILVLFVAVSLCRGEDPEHCLHHFKEHRGVITTPGFPGPFPVPIKCKWVINATGAYNSSIVVYLTQLYVTSGLKFTEYGSFEGGRGEVGLLQMNEKRMERTAFLRSEKPYLVIELDAESLEGNHFRALNNLLDVFGFNITYEIVPRSSTTKKTCTALGCSLAGNCYATWDFSEYRCSCFRGFHGKFCGHGPLCDPSRNVTYCHNGGVCTHMGAEAFKCTCPDHFSGPLCEKPKDDTGCKDGQCSAQCPFNGGRDSVCNCGRGSKIPPDRTRYEGTFRLVDWTKIREIPMKNPENIIEKELINYMSHNLSKVENLKVLNITPDGEMTFHFFGVKDDRGRVRAALNGLLQKGRLGNLTLHDTRISFKSEPALLLEAVRVNRERILRVDDEFTLSCIAKGSQLMEFRWYKDGVYVNVTAARRHMWQTLLPKNSDSQYTALLSIDHATKLDTGQYTCQVVDWGIQHCKSIYLEVLLPPIVKVNPMSVTLEKGQNVNITCMSPNDKRYEKFGYIWTKNKKLLGIIPGREVIEDLYPVGTILKIFHAQASATYTCHVSGNMAVQNFSVRVEVVDKEQVPLCPEEKLFGVMWPAAAPAQAAIQECPKNYLGNATRMCVLVDVKRTKWQLPDFSNCESEYLENIFKNFRNLMLGYQNTTGRATLQALLYYLQNRTFLYPGEGERVIEIVKDVQSYLNKSNIVEEFLESSQAFYHIMALLLEFDHSIINRKKVIQFQQQMKTHALVWGSLMTPPNSGHIVSNSLVVDIACLEGGIPNNMHLPLHSTSYPSWFTDKLDVRIEPFATDPTGNGTFSIAITVYRNLSKFLPLRYVKKLGNGVDVEYEFNSKIVMVELSKEGREIGIIPGTIGVVIDFDHVTKDYTSKQWNTTCGLASLRNVPYRWDLNTCILRTINNNITRCECDRPGAYAVLLTTHITPPMLPASLNYHVVVVVGCACCLIQTVLTLFLLLPYWWHHRTCLIFLKLQCCTATTGAMAVFLYAVRDSVPKASYPYVSTSLEAFLLVGMSSHLSKLLIVYTEVAPITNVKHLKETVVSIITGVPVLAVFCNHLAHHSTGWHLKSWWLVCGTMIFNIFVASAAIMMVMFIFLYYSVMQKLKILAAMNTGKSKVIGKRVGLLQCAAIIFSTTVVMETASIFYINVPNIIFHYFFSFTSALLGFIIFLCYILKSETPLHIQVMLKLKLENAAEDDYSSDSMSNALKRFTKQDIGAGDGESDIQPMQTVLETTEITTTTAHDLNETESDIEGKDVEDSLIKSDVKVKITSKVPPPSEPPSTQETYVQEGSDDSEEKKKSNGTKVNDETTTDINLESYDSSPKKYNKEKNQIEMTECANGVHVLSDYREHDAKLLKGIEHWKLRGHYMTRDSSEVLKPEPGRCYIRDSPEVVIRACVELVPQSRCLEETPAVLTCSVDVEQHRFEVTQVEVPIDLAANVIPKPGEKTCVFDQCPSVIVSDQSSVMSDDMGSSVSKEQSDGSSSSGWTVQSASTMERKQPEGREKPASTENMEGMLDRISHDLDYLLNRNTQAAKDNNTQPTKKKKTGLRVHIQEEEDVFLIESPKNSPNHS